MSNVPWNFLAGFFDVVLHGASAPLTTHLNNSPTIVVGGIIATIILSGASGEILSPFRV
jgi:hypothetical protein